MKPTINLATRRIIQKKTLRKFFLSSILFFGIAVIITLGLLTTNFFLNLQISNFTDQKSTFQAEIARSQSVKDKLLMVQERLGQIRSLLATRNMASERINLILSVIPDPITILSVQYTSEDITVSLASNSLLDLQNLIEQELPKISQSGNKDLGKITVSSFRLDPENLRYLSSFSITQVARASNPAAKKEIVPNE